MVLVNIKLRDFFNSIPFHLEPVNSLLRGCFLFGFQMENLTIALHRNYVQSHIFYWI